MAASYTGPIRKLSPESQFFRKYFSDALKKPDKNKKGGGKLGGI
jgi:hypothetical protein